MRYLHAFAATLSAGTLLSPVLAQTAPPRQAAGASDAATAPARGEGDVVVRDFIDPPSSARPRVWWHWLNGNITRDGITKDIEWMKRVGIGGLQNFDADLFTPKVVEKRLEFMQPEWKDAFRHAATLADRNGLELAIAASPGWSETGGPWVAPQDGMKKLVWSDTIVKGGKRFQSRLAAPPVVTGPYQDIAIEDPLDLTGGRKPPVFYADIAVLAYPVAPEAKSAPVVATAGDGAALDAAALTDDSLATSVKLPRGTAKAPSIIALDYAAPRTMRSATLFVLGAKATFATSGFAPRLEASDDGKVWRTVAKWDLGPVPTTISFAPVTARRFRVVMDPLPGGQPMLGDPAPGVDIGSLASAAGAPQDAGPKPLEVAEFTLSETTRLHEFERKAAFDIAPDYYALDAKATERDAIDPARVLNITDRMQADGTIDWTPPKGSWQIVRLGYSLTGKTNHPAAKEATGLEVDKYDARAVRAYLDHYLGLYRDAAGADLIGAKGVRALLTDSIEVGMSNWTPQLIAQFQRLRGYDPTPYLPTLTGAIVGSSARSDKFLYDYRRTLSDLLASEHYGTIAAVAHENGLKVYGEALEDRRPGIGDDMQMRAYADVPMAAMWTFSKGGKPRPPLLADIKGAASVAHIYGQNLVAAESMTSMLSPWAYAPADLRRVIDLEFALGVNRPVIHTSVHQPLDDKQPGLALFIFGQYFNRHETWAEMARPWMDYIARNSFLLQQGRNVADIAYFYGEEAPLSGLYAEKPVADAPTRYAFDYANADVVLNKLKVENGELVAPGGARYRALYLGGTSAKMTLPVLRQIAALMEAGATIVGKAPETSPSLHDDPAAFRTLVSYLWKAGNGSQRGRGRVIASTNIEEALGKIGVLPDFDYTRSQPNSEILFVHRRVDDGDTYYLFNRRDRREIVEARFRVTGKVPEIWHADTGMIEKVSYRTEGGVTIVPLEMAPESSFHVVFRKPAASPSATEAVAKASVVQTLAGPWSVLFQPGRGAPAATTLNTLDPLNENADAGIRYFSGVATYSKSFALDRKANGRGPLWLDLGSIGDVAEVRVNGRAVGTTWHAPYRLNIRDAVRPGRNQITVRVANLWVNRLVGDAQKGAKKVTFTTLPAYTANAPLRPSGLFGPVTIQIDYGKN
ncbi:MAG TPA: glycosyl hydrolase [Sphingobium sp.]|uniref:glycosyl hydrolase n=1 Tax=Sphingobium sp. TaxID=1912891 RepID=UPI002ED568CA